MSKDPDQALRAVFGDVLACDVASLTDDASPGSVKGWDSVNHMQLLLAIEEAFGVQFQREEFASLTTFGALRRRLSDGTAA